MTTKRARILFFIAGPMPSDKDIVAASKLNADVVYRNANAVSEESQSLEICDGVAGKVPPIYEKAYPSAKDAIAAKEKEIAALAAKVGDEPAPKVKTEKDAEKQKAPQPNQGEKDAKPAAWNPNAAQ